jgi:hypothetical protein
MIIRWLLFETRLGELVLTVLERKAGLAVQPAGQPKAVCETP